MADPQIATQLPENAYRELKPGETYVPMVPASVIAPEVTFRSIVFGIVMNILFSMAATFLALKVGQGIETAIPISILAVGLSGFLMRFGLRGSSLLENVNVLAISTTSGIVAGGTVFTMPAIYVLKLQEKLHLSDTTIFLQIFLVPLFGAALGVLFLIPFRRYFVKDMHGKLPFPEATATNEILVTGASGAAGQAWILIYSFLIGFVYNALAGVLHLFNELFTTGYVALEAAGKSARALAVPGLENMTTKVKAIFFLGTSAELLGLGFIIGLRYASIICAGSFLSWFVIIPLLAPLDLEMLRHINPAVGGDSASDIFRAIPRNIGIGGIFTAGLISILKMGNVIITALRQALGGLFASKRAETKEDRTDEDIPYGTLLLIGIAITVAMFFYFRFVAMAGIPGATRLTIISVALSLGIAFLFTTVSAWAIAMISVTPISGMTVTTIIITAVALLAAGLPKDEKGMLATLLVGGVVASALSMAGTLVTEFKIGFWLGASPKRIQWSALLASVLASALVAATIMFLASERGFDPEVSANALPAPQANVMASALKSFVGGGDVPWLMYGAGAMITLSLSLMGISGLAFSLGMYLPMELNTPILVGAIIASLVSKSTKDEKRSKARSDKGILIASGLIAGGAILGVFNSFLGAVAPEFAKSLSLAERSVQLGGDPATLAQRMNWLALIAFAALCVFSYVDCLRAKPGDEGGK